MKRCPAQSRTANAIDTTSAPRKDVAAPAARPKGPAAKKAVQKTPTSRSGGQRGTSTWWYKIPAHGERARCNFVLHNAILLARAAGDRHPSSFAAYLLMGLPTMADFRPGGLAASVHPCAHSTGRGGLATPFLLCRRLARGGLYGRRRHWINRLFIYLSATLYYRNWPLSTLLPTPAPRPGSSLR